MAKAVVGLALWLVAVVAQAGPMTVAQAQAGVTAGEESVIAYVVGLAHGAYVGYIAGLEKGGLAHDVAASLASRQCGDVSPGLLLEKAAKSPLAGLPVTEVIPILMVRICTHENTRA